MSEHLTYSDLPDEDKLLMDDLYRYKSGKEKDRKIIRNILASLKKMEMDCTKEIMNLSQRNISEKFDLCVSGAKPLSKRNRENIEDRISKEKIKQNKSGSSGLSFKKQQDILNRINKNKMLSEKIPSKLNCENHSGAFILSSEHKH